GWTCIAADLEALLAVEAQPHAHERQVDVRRVNLDMRRRHSPSRSILRIVPAVRCKACTVSLLGEIAILTGFCRPRGHRGMRGTAHDAKLSRQPVRGATAARV